MSARPWHMHRDSQWPGERHKDVDEADEPPYSELDLPVALRWASVARWGSGALWHATDSDLAAFSVECRNLGYELTNVRRGDGQASYRFRVRATQAITPAPQRRRSLLTPDHRAYAQGALL